MKQLLLDIAPSPPPTLTNFVPGRNTELLQTLGNILAGSERERFIYLWGGAGVREKPFAAGDSGDTYAQ